MRRKAYCCGLVLLLVPGIWWQPAGAAVGVGPTLYVLAIGISDYADDGVSDFMLWRVRCPGRGRHSG